MLLQHQQPATVWLTRTPPAAVLLFCVVVGMIAVLSGPVDLPLPR